MKLICEECNEPMYGDDSSSSTLVGYMSAPGHDHDDNCLTRRYRCANGHEQVVSVIRKCYNPECDWVGKTECWCCDSKLDAWPT